MPLFRDLEGNHFDIPAAELERFAVRGELPEDARLTGLEVPSAPPPPPGAPPLPRYLWREADPGGAAAYTVHAAAELPVVLDGPAYLLVPVQRAVDGDVAAEAR